LRADAPPRTSPAPATKIWLGCAIHLRSATRRQPDIRVMGAGRNLGEFDITGDVKITKIRLDT
jgi:hypothetical protein